MAKLNLKAEDAGQERVLAYLEENASDQLVEKINAGTKTMAGCWSYIRGRARSLAKNQCAVVEDKEVFGWAVHYFEEDDLNSENGTNKGGGTVDPKVHAKYEKVLEEQAGRYTETPLTSEKNGDSHLTFKGSPNLKEVREAKRVLESMEKNMVEDHKSKKKIEEQRKKTADIEGQLSLFDLLGGE